MKFKQLPFLKSAIKLTQKPKIQLIAAYVNVYKLLQFTLIKTPALAR
jgi:hypothetical protein